MKTKNSSPKDDLLAIREMMERSTKFLSLSGLSGIFAGVCALAGAAVVYFGMPNHGQFQYDQNLAEMSDPFANPNLMLYLLVGLIVLIVATIGAFYFSVRKARKAKQPFWTKSSSRLFMHLLIPFVTGGILTVIFIFRNEIQMVAPITLIFYGLALVNAGKFTFGEIQSLGLIEILLGILAAIFINHGLLFWALGFGVMHIVYGAVMYYRHER